MKSIAVLCNYRLDPNRIGGMDFFFWEFDAACKLVGHQVIWFFPNEGNHGKYPTMQIIIANQDTIENCFLKTLTRQTNNFDIIIAHFLELCTPFYKKIKLQTSAKVVAVDHNPRPKNGYSIKKRIKKILNGFMFSKYIDLFISVSKQTTIDLKKDFIFIKSDQIKVIHNGLPIDQIKTKKKMHKTIIHFMVSSHLRSEKGISDLLKAFKKLPESLKNKAIIDIYGDGPEKDALNHLINTYGLNQFINLKGSTRSIHSKYADYDFLIHPSHAETFCYAVVEALMANLPVITTQNAGNILNLIENNINGFVYPIGNVDALTSILNNVIEENIDLHIQCRKQYATLFSIERMVSNYLQLI
jgi:glycosyltransferase involved in cell wall biosynthesis